MYSVSLTRQAEKHFRKIPKNDRERLKTVLQQMTTSPLDGDLVKLSGHDAYRRRVGNYRIIFSIFDTELTILVFDTVRRNEKTYTKL